MRHPFAQKISSRIGAFIVGIIDMVLGLTGVMLVLLDMDRRHLILNPKEEHRLHYFIHDAQKDSFQFFIEYWMPSLSMLLVGTLVIITAITRRNIIATMTFVLSTIQMAGFVAGLFALLLSGVNRVGVVPFLIVTLLQFFFHCIITHFTHFAWGSDMTVDTEDLIGAKYQEKI
ncbi:unnamed protein product [Allacma fusca]|uniref:Uncharacterized protein n=1 Tax=Allacma fusca TaxID=39272 RepID=A0A8J2KUD9_9HEXA|nr:unnamed protein product [Allacma fusca]